MSDGSHRSGSTPHTPRLVMIALRRNPATLPRLPLALILAATAAGCAGSAGGTGEPLAPGDAADAEWRALAVPRPEPLEGAPRITVAVFQIIGGEPWGLSAAVEPALGVTELVAAGLLRRRDVRFVERRRFAAAAERERRGLPRRDGAPPAGVSPGAELVLAGTWARVGLDSAYLELRLTETESGELVKSWRATTADRADPAALARTIVGSLLSALEEMGRLPAWRDPEPDAAPERYRDSGIPVAAVESFLRGLAAEERWDWDGARRGYQAALQEAPTFLEAEAALARAARLRLGETLGKN